MRLPNKVTSFKESILSKLPLILKPLQTKDYPVIVLYEVVQENSYLLVEEGALDGFNNIW